MVYIKLENLETYKLARKLSAEVWTIYATLNYQQKKIIGDQLVRACDSVGANIAEGYGRYHYLDKCKFYYNARGSCFETKHWIELMSERQILTQDQDVVIVGICDQITITLNRLISTTKKNL